MFPCPARERKRDEKGDNQIQPLIRLLSLEDACWYLSCSDDLLEGLIVLGEVPVIRLGREPKGERDRRKRWVDRYDLDALIESRKAPYKQTTRRKEG